MQSCYDLLIVRFFMSNLDKYTFLEKFIGSLSLRLKVIVRQ